VKVSIVYVSYRPDLIWLVHSLQLLFQHLKGDYEVIVRLDENCREVVKEWGVPAKYIFLSHCWPDGYTHAMYQKMIADDCISSDTDIIWLLDSDHMLLREAHVNEFFFDGKPIIHYAEFIDLPEEYARVAQAKWKEPTERALGIPLDREYMITPPMAFWPDTLRSTRQRIVDYNRVSFIDFAYSDRPFKAETFLEHPMTLCDYETLGLYAATFESIRYAVRPVPKEWPFKVYWSHGPLPDELGKMITQ
jgi:hypothetical protein